jgi:hypothetical protein
MVMMTNKQNAEELFEIIGKDSQCWLAQAKELKMIADTILPNLQTELTIPPSYPGTQQKRLAYVGSYMLLTGLALENAIKGILIGRDPTLVTKEKIESGILGRKGHGIAEGAEKIIGLTAAESQLLKRIEEYLLWAGRYPLPIKSGMFFNSEVQELRTYMSSDRNSINELFERLVQVLEQEGKMRK